MYFDKIQQPGLLKLQEAFTGKKDMKLKTFLKVIYITIISVISNLYWSKSSKQQTKLLNYLRIIYLKGFLVLKISIVNEKDAFLFSDLLGDIKRLSELKGFGLTEPIISNTRTL